MISSVHYFIFQIKKITCLNVFFLLKNKNNQEVNKWTTCGLFVVTDLALRPLPYANFAKRKSRNTVCDVNGQPFKLIDPIYHQKRRLHYVYGTRLVQAIKLKLTKDEDLELAHLIKKKYDRFFLIIFI